MAAWRAILQLVWWHKPLVCRPLPIWVAKVISEVETTPANQTTIPKRRDNISDIFLSWMDQLIQQIRFTHTSFIHELAMFQINLQNKSPVLEMLRQGIMVASSFKRSIPWTILPGPAARKLTLPAHQHRWRWAFSAEFRVPYCRTRRRRLFSLSVNWVDSDFFLAKPKPALFILSVI